MLMFLSLRLREWQYTCPLFPFIEYFCVLSCQNGFLSLYVAMFSQIINRIHKIPSNEWVTAEQDLRGNWVANGWELPISTSFNEVMPHAQWECAANLIPQSFRQWKMSEFPWIFSLIFHDEIILFYFRLIAFEFMYFFWELINMANPSECCIQVTYQN